jgi:hypothetical protein
MNEGTHKPRAWITWTVVFVAILFAALAVYAIPLPGIEGGSTPVESSPVLKTPAT